MKPIRNGIVLYINIPRPVALKHKITEETEFVLLDDETQLIYVKKEVFRNGRHS